MSFGEKAFFLTVCRMTEEQPKIEEVTEDGPPPLEEFKAGGMPDLGAAAGGAGFGGFEEGGERGQVWQRRKKKSASRAFGSWVVG